MKEKEAVGEGKQEGVVTTLRLKREGVVRVGRSILLIVFVRIEGTTLRWDTLHEYTYRAPAYASVDNDDEDLRVSDRSRQRSVAGLGDRSCLWLIYLRSSLDFSNASLGKRWYE